MTKRRRAKKRSDRFVFLQWWSLGPVALAMLIALFVPGFAWIRTSVRSALVAFGVSPAFTLGILTILSILSDRFGVPWEATKVLPILGMIFIGGCLTWLLVVAKRSGSGRIPSVGTLTASIGPRKPLGATQLRVRVSTWVTIGVGILLAVIPMVMVANPRDPVQQWDSTFHLNGVHSILDQHSASPFGGLAPLYGGSKVFYPTAWHAFVSLFATSRTVVEAANVSSLLVMVVWVVGVTAFVSVITTSRAAILAAPILAGTLLNMPADSLTMYNQWPHATGLAVVPGIAALSLIVGRRLVRSVHDGGRGIVHLIPLGLFCVIGCIGAIGAHPSSAFTLAIVLGPAAVTSLTSLARRSWSHHSRGRAGVFLASALLVVIVPCTLLLTDSVRAMGNYPRSGIDWPTALARFITPFPPFAQTFSFDILIVIQTVLVLLGIVVMLGLDVRVAGWLGHPHRASSSTIIDEDEAGLSPSERIPGQPPRLRWPIVSYAIFALFTLLSYAPDSAVRTFLLAPWYMDPRRIMGSHGLMMVPIMAIGFAACTRWLHGALVGLERLNLSGGGAEHASRPSHGDGAVRRWQVDAVVGMLLISLSFGGSLDSRIWAVNYVYDADHLGKPGMATTAELSMIRRMQLRIPADSLVLGDPIAGAAYVQVIGQHTVVFPQLTTTLADSATRDLLTKHFNEIHTNPQVCDVVRKLGITHFYEDEDGWYYNFLRSSRHPGLYNVDTSTGFELLDEGGSAKIYKITACGDVAGGGHIYK
ncbi:DUF6541 family protein [Schaalia sp. ZJ1691]|uniref:DUF6541 family protein n=1 Tax=Schaalia sp. ZJ1691 TaxID=2709404 RepID=UPI003216975D